MRSSWSTPTEKAEALERAADMARAAGDREHEKELRRAALFNRRLAREQEAGVDGWPVCAFTGD
jgi:hypothetical protein